ncbi:MAG TPA: hypothetical protein VGE97_04650 [Nitrososphaera sp.]|jgi:hypothetical protein
MSDITVIHTEHDGTPINTFRPENLNFTLRKGQDGPHDITYEISRSNTSTDMVGAYRTDFILEVDSSAVPYVIMRGMHTSAPQITTDEERIQIAGKDWLHYLERRYWPFNDSDPNFYRTGAGAVTDNNPPTGFSYYVDPLSPQDSMKIVTDLLDQILSLPNSMALTYTLPDIGHDIEFFSVDIFDSENILSKIQTLSQEDPGEFDFWVDSDKEFHVAAPYRYDIDVVGDNSLAVHTFDALTPSSGLFSINYENIGPGCTRLYGSGANQSSTLVATREYGPGSTQFRLLEDHVSYTGVITRERVQRLTRRDLLFRLNPIHNVSISVVPESITNFWSVFHPGVAIWLIADLEAHTIDAAFEVVSIDGQSDTDGNMLATLNLNQIYDPDVTIDD